MLEIIYNQSYLMTDFKNEFFNTLLKVYCLSYNNINIIFNNYIVFIKEKAISCHAIKQHIGYFNIINVIFMLFGV